MAHRGQTVARLQYARADGFRHVFGQGLVALHPASPWRRACPCGKRLVCFLQGVEMAMRLILERKTAQTPFTCRRLGGDTEI